MVTNRTRKGDRLISDRRPLTYWVATGAVLTVERRSVKTHLQRLIGLVFAFALTMGA